jgi:hypothetical protein
MKAWLLRVAFFGIPVLILAFTIAAFTTGSLFMRPMGGSDDLPAKLELVSALSGDARWEEAGATLGDLTHHWEQVRRRIRFSAAVEEIEEFDLELAGLRGAVEARDEAQVQIAFRRLQALWRDLGE